MGIADAQDFIYDSAILLPENGFTGVGSDSNCDSLTSAGNLSKNSGLDISPNPFTDKIQMAIHKQSVTQATFILYDIFGQIAIKQQEINLTGSVSKTLDVSFLSSGIYFLDIYIDGEHVVKKLIKN
jgi:hypothetical protein